MIAPAERDAAERATSERVATMNQSARQAETMYDFDRLADHTESFTSKSMSASRRMIQDHPAAAITIAAAVGLSIGCLVKWWER